MVNNPYRLVTECRICGSRDLEEFLSLGTTPLANAFVRPEDRVMREESFPLAVMRCLACGLVLLTVVVPPDLLFRSYPYASSSSPPLLEHFDDLAAEVATRFARPGELVVEIGSNDGVLLRPLKARSVQTLGIEPAMNLAALANASGLETWNEFFDTNVAARIVREKGPATAVLANNVVAHMDDLHELAMALDFVLSSDGVFVAEVPYLVDLLDHVEYDTIYHEHLSYLSVRPVRRLFAMHALELFDVRRLAIHGGSIRLFVGRAGRHAVSGSIHALESLERENGIYDGGAFARFSERVSASRIALRELLGTLRVQGKRLAGYGATAKGNTLLNYCELGPETLEFVADTTPFKQGLLTPGTHIPVVSDEEMLTRKPDYAVLLAWNYADAILRRQARYVSEGGRFIHPIPLARIL